MTWETGFIVFHRLTPVYMLILMFYGCLFHYIGDGPFYVEQIPDADNCRKTWWQNLLYINNFFDSPVRLYETNVLILFMHKVFKLHNSITIM